MEVGRADRLGAIWILALRASSASFISDDLKLLASVSTPRVFRLLEEGGDDKKKKKNEKRRRKKKTETRCVHYQHFQHQTIEASASSAGSSAGSSVLVSCWIKCSNTSAHPSAFQTVMNIKREKRGRNSQRDWCEINIQGAIKLKVNGVIPWLQPLSFSLFLDSFNRPIDLIWWIWSLKRFPNSGIPEFRPVSGGAWV